MSAKDFFHDIVKNALIKEHWTITADPFWIKLKDSDINLYIDLAAEQMFAAEKGEQKIAIEIKSFIGNSLINNFHEAIGQFLDYRIAIREKEPERELYLAIPLDIYNTFFKRRFIETVCKEYKINLLVFNPTTEEIISWIK